jgi:hypothetical protein
VIRRQVELVVGHGERARLLDLGGHDRAQPVEPGGADVAGHDQEAVGEVPLARPLVEHQRRPAQDVLAGHCASAPPSTTTSLPVMYDDSSEAR